MKTIEYFYSAHSSYAYLGAKRLREVARAAGARIVHKPMELRELLAAVGGVTGSLTPERSAYFFGREIDRWAEFRAIPILDHRPSFHDHSIARSNCFLIAAAEADASIDNLSEAVLRAHWVDDADLDDPETLVAIAATVGVDGHALLAAAATPAIQAIHRANTEAAIARPMFGSPTYLVDGDMFYGQDRLDLVARALEQPFAQARPSK